MLDPSAVSAVLVTRGDVGVHEICDSLRAAGIDDIVIWNNRIEHDVAVYGRYAGIERARHPVIYVQDDDCVLEPDTIRLLLEPYEPGVAVCNVPERFRQTYTDSALVGFGAVFDRELPERAFSRMSDDGGILTIEDVGFFADAFNRRADNVFTTLTPLKLVDLPYRDLPWASAPGRMWTTPGHTEERDRMIDLARKVRDA